MNIICYLKELSNENCYILIELIDFENTIVMNRLFWEIEFTFVCRKCRCYPA